MDLALKNSRKFRQWRKLLLQNGLKINDISQKWARYKSNGDPLFALLELDAEAPDGHRIPPVCFLKGEVVSILICLIDRETDERFLLLVEQRRICTGGEILEQVAGMVEEGEEPIEVAVREVEEETGLSIRRDQLIPLNDTPFFPSTGTSDEAMHFFYCELTLSKEEIMAYDDTAQGAEDENEQIQTRVLPLAEARRRMTHAAGLLNTFLYLEVKGETSLA